MSGTKTQVLSICVSMHMFALHVWIWVLFYRTIFVTSHFLLAWLYYTHAYTMAKIFAGWWRVFGSSICSHIHFVLMQMQNTTDAGSYVCIQTAIYKYVKSFWTTDFILDSERTCMRHALHPCNRSSVCKPSNTGCEANLHFVNLYLYGVHDRETDPTVILLIGHPLFQLGGCMNFQNKRFPILISKIPLRVVKVGVWCAAIVIIQLVFKHIKKLQKASVSVILSVLLHGTTWPPLDTSLWNLILGYFFNLWRKLKFH